jgi:hypothetical protein
VKSRRFQVLAATVGLWMAHNVPGYAQPPSASPPSRLAISPTQPTQSSPTASANQQLADAVAGELRQSGQLRHYDVGIRAEAGVVTLTGQVTHETQREEVLRLVQGVPGVERVRDQIQIVSSPVTTVAATSQPLVQEPRPLMQSPMQDKGFTAPAPTPMPPDPSPAPREPVAIGATPPGMQPPPPLPPYAWPTYAPYNNYSKVAYPTQYPLQTFPFIGPFYPYPKVPLGWRSVTLKWEDGHWWFGRNGNGHDWWRVRYW